MLVAVAVFCMATAFAQTVKQHIVKRGETLESIADRYGTTVDELVELNPDANQFVYVGMELKVPVSTTLTSQQDTIKSERVQIEQPIIETNLKNRNLDYVTIGNFVVNMEIGLSFIANKPIDESFGFTFTTGANYFFTKSAYAGARIGVNSVSSTSYEAKSSAYFLMIPLEAGYAFCTSNEKLAVIPFCGFDFNIGIKGKTEIRNYDDVKLDIGGKIGVDACVGLRFRLWSFNLSGAYHIPLNDKQKGFFGKDPYLHVSLGWGF